MDIKVKDEFTKWAKGFSGCDGGNIDGPIWICGIEYGGNEELTFSDVSQPKYYSSDDDREKLIHGTQRYNVKALKLYSAILGHDVSSYRNVALENKFLDKDSDLFKLNLYPIPFKKDKDDLWTREKYDQTGLPTKSIYRAWCQLYLFDEIRKWAKKHSPKLIIATGISYYNEFIMAFGGIDTVHNAEIKKEKILDRELLWLKINDDRTILAITPFLGGRYGLNSDELLEQFGKDISNICMKMLGVNWISV